jgi:predicted naringenin-chalcone synthase
MHMLLFDIVPLHNDALLILFSELLHPFKKEVFSVAHGATCALLAGHHHASQTCATRANISHRSSLIKASTLWMCWSVCDVEGPSGRLSSVTLVLSSLKRSVHS